MRYGGKKGGREIMLVKQFGQSISYMISCVLEVGGAGLRIPNHESNMMRFG